MEDERIILTPEQATALLCDHEYIHNFANPAGGMFIGYDYERADAIAAFGTAKKIELAGENAKGMKHPIAVWDKAERLTFFEADMDKVAEFEAREDQS